VIAAERRIAAAFNRVGSGDWRPVQQQKVALGGARKSLLQVQTERLVQRVNRIVALGGCLG
jgi:hypothetical protein